MEFTDSLRSVGERNCLDSDYLTPTPDMRDMSFRAHMLFFDLKLYYKIFYLLTTKADLADC